MRIPVRVGQEKLYRELSAEIVNRADRAQYQVAEKSQFMVGARMLRVVRIDDKAFSCTVVDPATGLTVELKKTPVRAAVTVEQ